MTHPSALFFVHPAPIVRETIPEDEAQCMSEMIDEIR
jgi:hypothetical protein